MKKIILSFLYLMVFTIYAHAQLVILDSEMDDITDQTITVNGTSDDSYFKVNVFLSNTGEEAVEIFVKKIEMDIADGAFITFCWKGSCFPPEVFDVQDPIVLEGDQITRDTDFYIEFHNGDTGGISEARYEFYSENESFDTVSVTVRFDISTTTFVNDFDARKSFLLSDPRPNPARGHTWIDYSVPAGTSNAQIVIRNLLGKSVLTENINFGSTRLRINTQNLNNGIYIYSLIIDNQIVESKRLVVTN
jgi:hypothetical protein